MWKTMLDDVLIQFEMNAVKVIVCCLWLLGIVSFYLKENHCTVKSWNSFVSGASFHNLVAFLVDL